MNKTARNNLVFFGKHRWYILFLWPHPIDFINGNNIYNYASLICNSLLCSSICINSSSQFKHEKCNSVQLLLALLQFSYIFALLAANTYIYYNDIIHGFSKLRRKSACSQHAYAPGFLKILLPACWYVCVHVFAPKEIIKQ